MDIQQNLGLILSILIAAGALVAQLQRLVVMTEQYMHELRDQNVKVNQTALALVAATQSEPPTDRSRSSIQGTDIQSTGASLPEPPLLACDVVYGSGKRSSPSQAG